MSRGRPPVVCGAWQVLVVAAALSVLLVAAAKAQIPPIVTVPTALPADVKAPLEARRTALMQQRGDLSSRIASHNQRCGAVPENSPLVSQCEQAQAALNADVNAYGAAVAQFNRDVAAAADLLKRKLLEEIDQLHTKIARDEEALRRTQRITTPEEFETWQRLNEKAREDTIRQSVGMLAGLLDQGGDRFAEWVNGLSPAQARALVRRLEGAGVDDPFFLAAIRGLATPRGKQRAAAAAEFLRRARKGLEGLELEQEVREGTWEGRLNAVMTVVSDAFEKSNPEYALLIGDVRLWTQVGYDVELRAESETRIRELSNLSLSQLRAVKTVSEVLRRHVNQLNRDKSALAALDGSR